MRIAELSACSGVPIPTIKYYLRERLMPPGERTGSNQARYDHGHLQRLRLVRVLTDLGGLPIATVREIVLAVDVPVPHADVLMETVQNGVADVRWDVDHEAFTAARALLADLGWHGIANHAALGTLAGVFAAARDLGHQGVSDSLYEYARACETIARSDLKHLAAVSETGCVSEAVVIGTVLGNTALRALRWLAYEVESVRRRDWPAGGVSPAVDVSGVPPRP
ncbi:MerR-like DNA binding protein [Lentzea atacamensis]|uniref:MerR-like DNA binding protein n=1 Tax=Lentzea atacamensis TaxID=531938 RepID=A0ABX9E875_9PSEU|nr:MerR family transcriptional regulator [Lentzea atacamensis]RAS65899.1 MerR-like DNA binding protein [Lentzea atacamensis]